HEVVERETGAARRVGDAIGEAHLAAVRRVVGDRHAARAGAPAPRAHHPVAEARAVVDDDEPPLRGAVGVEGPARLVRLEVAGCAGGEHGPRPGADERRVARLRAAGTGARAAGERAGLAVGEPGGAALAAGAE